MRRVLVHSSNHRDSLFEMGSARGSDHVGRSLGLGLTVDAVVSALLHLHGDNRREFACRAAKRQTREI